MVKMMMMRGRITEMMVTVMMMMKKKKKIYGDGNKYINTDDNHHHLIYDASLHQTVSSQRWMSSLFATIKLTSAEPKTVNISLTSHLLVAFLCDILTNIHASLPSVPSV